MTNKKILVLTEKDFRNFIKEDEIQSELFKINVSWFESRVTEEFLKSDIAVLQYKDCLKVIKNRTDLNILEIIKELK